MELVSWQRSRRWHALSTTMTRQGAGLQIEKEKKKHTVPPTSLVGQLLWREFFYAAGAFTPNYDKMEGNPVCKQVLTPLHAPLC